MNILTTNETLRKGLEIVGYSAERIERVHRKTNVRRFKRHFGPSPTVVGVLWAELQTTTIAAARLPRANDNDFKHYLMTLHFLKSYPLEEELASRYNVHEQTVRKWTGTKLAAEQNHNRQERLGGGRPTPQSTTTGAMFTSRGCV